MVESESCQNKMLGIISSVFAGIVVAIFLSATLIGCSGGVVDNANKASFGGITFAMPSGWEATVSGNTLKIQIPEKEGVIATVTGTHIPANHSLSKDLEESALDAFVGGVLKSLTQSDIKVLDRKRSTIDGKPTEIVKSSATISGSTVGVYVFAAITGDGLTSIFFGSSNGVYNDQFEGIIKSARIA